MDYWMLHTHRHSKVNHGADEFLKENRIYISIGLRIFSRLGSGTSICISRNTNEDRSDMVRGLRGNPDVNFEKV